MNLPILNRDDGPAAPWYADGLTFTCTTCGNCCTGGPGYVWVTTEEVRRLAEHLRLTPEEVVERYCRRVGGRLVCCRDGREARVDRPGTGSIRPFPASAARGTETLAHGLEHALELLEPDADVLRRHPGNGVEPFGQPAQLVGHCRVRNLAREAREHYAVPRPDACEAF